MAAPGYPEKAKKGVPIHGDLENATPSSYFIHAGTCFADGHWLTNGGRVLGAVGLGSTLKESLTKAYEQASKASWEGLQMRKDIGLHVSTSL